MRAADLTRKKRDSGEHSREELEFLISGYTNGDRQSAVPGEDEFYAVGQYQSEGLIGSEAIRSQTPHRPISHVCQGGLLFLISTHACRKLRKYVLDRRWKVIRLIRTWLRLPPLSCSPITLSL